MTIYDNAPQVLLELQLTAPGLTLPRIRQIETGRSGARIYERASDDVDGYADPTGADLLFVTPAGHWYRADDQQDPQQPMPCRGCDVAGLDYVHLDQRGRCPRPPSAQDIADALLGRSAVAA